MELILGHNQFIGISHISEEKSREKERLFSDVKKIFRIVESANKLGYDHIIIETHPKMVEFINHYQKFHNFEMNFFLQVPYVQGYIQKINESGIHGFAYDTIKQTGLIKSGNIALKGVYGMIMKDYSSIANSFLNLELSPFSKVNIKAVLLHNVITDLLLAIDAKEAFTDFILNIQKMGLKFGFVTLNFPLLYNKFSDWGLLTHIVMTPVNPKGFDMNPNKEVVSHYLKKYDGDIIAMNILGGGAFSLHESKKLLDTFQNIKFCVIGASSLEHLKENIELFC